MNLVNPEAEQSSFLEFLKTDRIWKMLGSILQSRKNRSKTENFLLKYILCLYLLKIRKETLFLFAKYILIH